MSEGCSRFGLAAQDVPLWEDTMVQALDSSPLICALCPGDFTEVGHFIVIAGYEEGAFRVLDPNSQANSEKAWSYDTLEPQIKAIWSFFSGGLKPPGDREMRPGALRARPRGWLGRSNYLAKTRFKRQNRGRPSSLAMPVSPWMRGRQ